MGYLKAVLLFTVVACGVARADYLPPQVTVDGQGSVTAAPDMALVTMSVQSRNLDLAAARADVLKITRRVLRVLEQLAIAETDVISSSLTVRPEYRWNNDSRQQELLAYLAQREFRVTVKQLPKLGELLEASVDVGVNQVSPPQLGHSRERELHRQALALAAVDAKANAQVLTEALGATLGEATNILSTTMPVPRPPQMMREMVMSASDAPRAETYQTGELTFEAQVRVSFDLPEARP